MHGNTKSYGVKASRGLNPGRLGRLSPPPPHTNPQNIVAHRVVPHYIQYMTDATPTTPMVSLPMLAKSMGVSRRALAQALAQLPLHGAGRQYAALPDVLHWLETGPRVTFTPAPGSLSISGLATVMGVNPDTIRNAINKGNGPALTADGRVTFEAAIAWLESYHGRKDYEPALRTLRARRILARAFTERRAA
jgi:hypothetical protein